MILPLLLLAPAWAVDPGDRILVTDRLALGVYEDGSLCNPDVYEERGTGLCLLWDPDGPEGPLPPGGDWLWVGDALEAWSATWTAEGVPGSTLAGGPLWKEGLALTWDEPQESASLAWIHGTGGGDAFTVDTWIEAAWGEDLVWFTLTFTASQDLEDLQVARLLDPDPDAWIDGSAYTLQSAASGYAVATSAYDGRSVALAAHGEGGACRDCQYPADIAASPTEDATGDDRIGVAVSVGNVASGSSATVVFALALALDPDSAVSLAEHALEAQDHDRDGVAADSDCDDRDPDVAPGQPEGADGLDNDCDGLTDEGTWADDGDGDGWTEAQGDCDDQDPAVTPDEGCDGLGDWPPPEGDDVRVATLEAGGCACAWGGGSGGLLAWILALGATALRRRSS